MKREILSVLAAVIAGVLALPAQAATFDLLVESDDDRDAGSEVFMATFDTFGDLLNSSSTVETSQINIGPNFSVGGLAYDGQFRLLVESDDDRDAGSEVFMATFDTFGDLLDSSSTVETSQINIGPNFSSVGLAYSGLPAPAAIPVPASLPLSLGALGLLGLFKVRRRRLAAS